MNSPQWHDRTTVSEEDVIADLERLGNQYAIRVLDEAPGNDASGWVSAAELWNDQGPLLERVLQRLMSAGCFNHKVAGSRLLQQYAGSVAPPVVATWLRWRLTLDVAVDNLAVHVHDRGVDTAAFVRRPAWVVEALPYASMLRNFTIAVDQVESRVHLRRRALWGNVAAGLSQTFEQLFDYARLTDADHGAVEAAARQLYDDPSFPFEETGQWVVVDSSCGRKLRFARSTCCLKFRGYQHDFCDNCSLRSLDERLGLWNEAAGVTMSESAPR